MKAIISLTVGRKKNVELVNWWFVYHQTFRDWSLKLKVVIGKVQKVLAFPKWHSKSIGFPKYWFRSLGL